MAKQDSSFGTWLKKRRKTLDLTQDELAQEVGCATITIRKIESNSLKPSVQIATRLSECCHIPPEEQEAFIRFARSEESGGHVWVDRTPGTPNVRFESDRPPNNLVTTANPLIGREDDLEVVLRRLKDDAVQLLTLVGPPGVGKTRFAIEVANQVLERFRDGVFVVYLAPVTDPEQALVQIAQTIGTKETGMRSIVEDLKSFLYDKELLLVLDNLEHIRELALPLEQILQTCFGVKILTTSREALRLRRERRYTLHPLPIPEQITELDIEQLRQIPAIALFTERAQAVNHEWSLTPENAADVISVCQQLNGLPLSIELIAARSTLLSPRAMLQQLSNQLAVLTSRSFDHPQRQRTLRDAIGWSVQLLAPVERDLFTYLGVFPQEGSLRAIEAICVGTEWEFGVLDALTALADKSLLQTQPSSNDDVRFDMLQVLREYARKHLNEHPDREKVFQRHAEYFYQKTKTIFDQLSLGQQQELFDQLHQEMYNLRASFEWFLSHQVSSAMHLVAWLADYWFQRGNISEGRRWIAQVIEKAETSTEPIADAVWIDMLNAAGFLAYHQNDYHRSTEYFSRSRELIERTDNPLVLGRVYNNLGLIAQWRGDYVLAETQLKKSLDLWSSIDFQYGTANAYGNLGGLYVEYGDHQKAQPQLQRSLDLWTDMHVERGISSVQLQQGKVLILQGAYQQAAEVIQASLTLAEATSNKNGIGFATYYQGLIALYQREIEQAHELFQYAYELSQDIGGKHLASLSLLGQGYCALLDEQATQAERFFQQSIDWSASMDYPLGQALAARGLAVVAVLNADPAQAQYILQPHVRKLIAINQYYGLVSLLETLALVLAKQAYIAQATQLAAHALGLRQQYQIARIPLDEILWQQCTELLASPLEPELVASDVLNQILDSLE